MVLIKNLKIFHLFIFGKIREENVFDDILERKKAFLDYKKQKVKKVQNWDFSKGVGPWFWSKIWNFSIFLFLAKSERKMCLTIFLQRKKAFLDYKKEKVKKVENWDFSKGDSPWFWSKIWKFSIFLFLAKSETKMSLMIF